MGLLLHFVRRQSLSICHRQISLTDLLEYVRCYHSRYYYGFCAKYAYLQICYSVFICWNKIVIGDLGEQKMILFIFIKLYYNTFCQNHQTRHYTSSIYNGKLTQKEPYNLGDSFSLLKARFSIPAISRNIPTATIYL